MLKNRDFLGKILFLISLGLLIYMLISPLTGVITHADEYFTIATVQFPFFDMIGMVQADVHPPLHYALLCIVNSLFGFNLYILKFTSIIPYIVILAISATKIKDEYSWLTVGLFTITLATMSDFFIHYLTIRMYAWALLFLLLSFVYLKDLIDNFDLKSWCLVTVFTICGVYTHYFVSLTSILLYILLLAYILKNNKPQLKNWFISAAVVIISYLPWVQSLLNQMRMVHDNFWVPPVDANMIFNAFAFYSVHNQDIVIAAISILLLVFFMIILVKGYSDCSNVENFYISCGIVLFLGTIVFLVILSVLFTPVLWLRYLVPVSSILWLSICILVGKIKNDRIFVISLLMIFLLVVVSFANTVDDSNGIYKSGLKQQKALDAIDGNDSIVVIAGRNTLLEFAPFIDDGEIYYVNNQDYNPNIHKLANFTEIDFKDIEKICSKNKDKNIYSIAYEDYLDNYIVDKLGSARFFKFGVIQYKE